jgi:hypothetical protein
VYITAPSYLSPVVGHLNDSKDLKKTP